MRFRWFGPQVLVTIKGQNLAIATTTSQEYPLRMALGGATVTFQGESGPLQGGPIGTVPEQNDLV